MTPRLTEPEKISFPTPLVDNHGQTINYLRLAVTDNCNLRCFYCMPAEGLAFLKRKALLQDDEIITLLKALMPLGINKLRFTGGEPFVRKGFMPLLERVAQLTPWQSLNLTTNGVLTGKFVKPLKDLGIYNVNLSLDTLDEKRFHAITRRDDFKKVMFTLEELLKHGVCVKINAVVMAGRNESDILPLAELAKDEAVEVRFIEEMPFNGSERQPLHFNALKIRELLHEAHPSLTALPPAHGETATRYTVEGFKGKLGIIAAFSRTFCGTCNRLRVNAKGELQTCLYGGGVLSLRDMLRNGAGASEIQHAVRKATNARAKDGFEAEKWRKNGPAGESMATIGG